MPETRLVDKSVLLNRIIEIVRQRVSGFLTILTDANRSVLLRFSVGQITHTHARSKDIGEAIHVLSECYQVRFSFAPAQAENIPAIFSVGAFLKLINPGGSDVAIDSRRSTEAVATSGADSLLPAVASALREADRIEFGGAVSAANFQQELLHILEDFIGPFASLLIEEAIARNPSLAEQINYIATEIPDKNVAAAFRDLAIRRLLGD
jgi:hypothetical protein